MRPDSRWASVSTSSSALSWRQRKIRFIFQATIGKSKRDSDRSQVYGSITRLMLMHREIIIAARSTPNFTELSDSDRQKLVYAR